MIKHLPGLDPFSLNEIEFSRAAAWVNAGSSPIIQETLPALAVAAPTPYSKMIRAMRMARSAVAGPDGPFIYTIGDGPNAEVSLSQLLARVDSLARWGGEYGRDNLKYLQQYGVVAIKVDEAEEAPFASQALLMDKDPPSAMVDAVEFLTGSKAWAHAMSCSQSLRPDGEVKHFVYALVRDELTGLFHSRAIGAGEPGADVRHAMQAVSAAAADALGLQIPRACRMSGAEARQLMRKAGIELVLLRDLLPITPGQGIRAARESLQHNALR